MTDYGHRLCFGAFLTPTAAEADQVVERAVLCEQVGLDLVTFQDHPYQPRFLDAWTLLSFVAARTSRVRLALDVACLPLRHPMLLGRSAASLDLLSGGRVELGLGAGAFWDAIVANGGPHRTPGEAVDALAESIDVIRSVWDASARTVRRPGTHYDIQGAKAGPAPTHPIGIWVGAAKPRMLRLVGRAADGWLPSLGWLPLRELDALNATIDESAEAAGRSPADIRRLVNIGGDFTGGADGPLSGPPALWAERLAELTLRHGFATYIVSSDDADDLRRFAAEVAPDVRERVAAGRS